MKALACVLLVVSGVLCALPVISGQRLECEDMNVIRCTSGETTAWKMVEDGFAKSGQFSVDSSKYWYDAAAPGAVLELSLPVEKSGRYAVSVGLVRYRTFGTFRFLMNGKAAGNPVDMYGNPGEDAALPFTVSLGTLTLKGGDNVLALRLTGTNENTIMPNHGAAVDWVDMAYQGATVETGETGVGTTGAQMTYEADKLRVARCTSGEAMPVKLAEDGYADAGTFTGDRSLEWRDAVKSGAVLELALPVQKKGRYSVSVRVAKYRTYGIHQFVLNGKPLGKPVDMFGNPGQDIVTAFTVGLGTCDLRAGTNQLAMRLVGTNPRTIMANHGAGLDWVRLQPAHASGATSAPLVKPKNSKGGASAKR